MLEFGRTLEEGRVNWLGPDPRIQIEFAAISWIDSSDVVPAMPGSNSERL